MRCGSKEELDRACVEVSEHAEQGEPGEEIENIVARPDNVQDLPDWIDFLKLLQLAAGQHGVGIRIDRDGGLTIYDSTPEEDEMDDLADRRYEDAKDEALFEGGC